MALCPANCVDLTMVPVPNGGCETVTRNRSLFKLGFYACSTTLTTPLTCEALQALVESNAVVFSNPLVNVEWAAPEFEELVVADCLPAQQRVIQRALNFQDRIAIDIPETSGSGANMFADLKFWGDKMEKPLALRYIFLFCDGSMEVAREKNGSPMAASLNVYRNFERQGTGGNSYMLEMKQGTVTFKGDPLALTADYEPSLIVDDACEELKVLLGL